MNEDERFMQRAIRLAMNGRGRVEPNPMVGCVIVKNGRVIGEGYHEQFGGPHAEPNALAACTESPEGATAYVTLEPCCHVEKKTPPCVPRLIEAKLGRVVVGAEDPNPLVASKGIHNLRGAGMRVDTGICSAEAHQLIAPFTAQWRHARSYVTLKWAQTADGRIAGPGGARLQITKEKANLLVHQLRARSDAIVVGINTVLIDDPLLTARGVELHRPLKRIVLDSQLQTPLHSKLTQSSAAGEVFILCSPTTEKKSILRIAEFLEKGIYVEPLELNHDGTLSLSHLVRHDRDTHMLVEPGPRLAESFFATNLVDRLWVFRSPKAINDPTAPAAAPIPDHFIPTGTLNLDGDTLTEYLNPNSPVFFAPVPSADFVLARDSV